MNHPQDELYTVAVTKEVAALIEALKAPERWQSEPALTADDVQVLRELMQTPLMRKVDVIMYNLAQQQMQRAAFGGTPDLVAAVKFAAGFKAGWEAMKTLTVLRVAETPESNEPEQEAGSLRHLTSD